MNEGFARPVEYLFHLTRRILYVWRLLLHRHTNPRICELNEKLCLLGVN